jgi:hypothetical protein
VDGLNIKGVVGRFWNPINFIRWAVTVAVMVFLKDYSFAQIFILLIVSVIFQIIIITAKPLIEPFDDMMTFILEAVVSSYLYVLLTLTDF